MRKMYSLDSNWMFTYVDESHEVDSRSMDMAGTEIHLPHTWNVGSNTERRLCLYEKELLVNKQHETDQLFLEFLGANALCQVYINDEFIGEHRGGYSTFRFDITDVYQWGGTNRLKVYVDNSQTEDISPLNGDFTIYGGLYRSVNLICVPETHFDLLFYGSTGVIVRSEVDETGNGVLNIESHVINGDDVSLELQVENSEGDIMVQSLTPGNEKTHQLMIEQCSLWNGKKDPTTYKLTARLKSEERIYDQVELTVGFRQYAFDSEKGFILNGERVRINGVAKHQDFEGVGNAITKEHIRKDFELIEEIGANAVRLSHYQHHQETYDMCDTLGLITWAEIPMMAMPNSESVMVNAKEQLKELVYQNCHHPSICFWGIQNEIAMGGESLAMYKGVHELNDLFHSLMPKELSASANMHYVENQSPLNFITDVLGYNLYYGWYYGNVEDLGTWFDTFHDENPNVSLGMSEYGADCNLKFHSADPKVKDYTEEYQALYHEKTYEIIDSKPYLWGSFVWNMFDFGSEVRDEGGIKGKNCKGLVTFDRETRKDAFYYYKAKWSDKPFVHIGEKRFVNRSEEKVTIKAYSNLEAVTLYVNDDEVRTVEGSSVFKFEDVSLQFGANTIKVVSVDKGTEYVDEATFVRTEEKDQSYIYVDARPGLNVENWFTQEKSELDFFPEDYFSIKDTMSDIMENEEAWEVLKEKAPKIVDRATPGSKVTLLWVFNKMRALFTEEQIMEINDSLVKIKK